MKKILPVFLFALLTASAYAQNGLESVFVERYYVSDANDATMNSTGGVLPVGSVTYRVYVDMLPGYKFQAAYGVPDHELRIETSTLFFNNEDRGATSPTYTKTQASHNTVMLDSWLSVGAACSNNFGVLKSEDDGAANVTNTDAVLANTDPLAGIPLTTQDGLLAGTPEAVTVVGLTTEIAMFDAQNDGTNGPVFSTFNGSWASLNGSTGPDASTNKVLIAQITTDGIFSFALNLQIGTPSGGVENYVAQNPIGTEILEPTLTFNSTTGVNTVVSSAKPDFTIYPNPVQSNLNLDINTGKTSGEVKCFIYDMLGHELSFENLGLVSRKRIVPNQYSKSFTRRLFLKSVG
ncbi:MAG: hypothetical protein IPP51_08395 [Bacteroidetes bacterium]|nr:hypothetical protein [Bacteroidota bacterium]